jgi:hypothetical protein
MSFQRIRQRRGKRFNADKRRAAGSLFTRKVQSAGRVLEPTDFAEFLAANPYLADGNLWADYYSTEVLMSAGAKAGMVLPDIRALPNVLEPKGVTVSAS